MTEPTAGRAPDVESSADRCFTRLECRHDVIPEAARYRPVRFTGYPIDEHLSLVYLPEQQRIVYCDRGLIRLLLRCQGSRTLSDHTQAFLGEPCSVHAPEVGRALETLVQAGLLQDDAPLFGTAAVTAADSAGADITSIAMITADRPYLARRCLESFAQHCSDYGRRPRFIVVDGSQDGKNRALNSQTVSEIRRLGHTVHLVGIQDSARIQQAVRTAGLRDAFPVTPGPAGTSRNLLLLLTAGENVLMVDDDIVCAPWAADAADEILLTGHTDAREVAFFTSREAALRAAPRVGVDLIATHNRLLGRSLPSIIHGSTRPPNLDDACVHVLSKLRAGRPLTVRVTISGLAGDSGFSYPERQLFGSGRALARLASSVESCRTGLRYREVHRIADRYMVTHDPHCMAYCMGVANRRLLPPFMPTGRNQDGVFGALLLACDSDALFGHLPCGIIHDSDRPATYKGPHNRSASETRMSEALICLIQHAVASDVSSDPLRRLKRIAAFFADLARTSTPDFESFVTHDLLEARHRELNIVEGTVSKGSECPDYWKSALVSYRNTLLANIVRRDFFLPIECRRRSPIEDGFRELQQSVAAFGRLLDHWSDLWDTVHRADIIRR